MKKSIKVGDTVEMNIRLKLPAGYYFNSGVVLKVFDNGMCLIRAAGMPNGRFSSHMKNLRRV